MKHHPNPAILVQAHLDEVICSAERAQLGTDLVRSNLGMFCLDKVEALQQTGRRQARTYRWGSIRCSPTLPLPTGTVASNAVRVTRRLSGS